VARAALRDRVGDWIRAGIISAEQADRILANEERTSTRSAGMTGRTGDDRARPIDPGARDARRTRIAEVVGYVGAAFALGAIGLLVAEFWSDLTIWARLALSIVLAVTAIGAGALLRGRTAAALQRLVGVLWLAGLAATAWSTGIVAWDVLDVPERWMPTVIGVVTLLVAAPLLFVGRHLLVQLAAFVALGSATAGTLVAIAPLEPGALAFGLMLLGGGATWGLAGAGGWLGPRVSAEVTGAIFLLIGAQVLTATGWPRTALTVGIGLAFVLVVLSVIGGRLHLLYIGAFGLFVAVPRLVFALFSDTLGAPATLLTTGVLLILMAVGLARFRRSQEVDHG
jgi:hypothetical protein